MNSFVRIDGKHVSEVRRKKLSEDVKTWSALHGRKPSLAVVLVGNIVASEVYVRNKEKACADVGIESTKLTLPAHVQQGELNQQIERLNADPSVDGILVQLPLPDHLDVHEVLLRISPEKDADGLTYLSMGLLAAGRAIAKPCTPQGVIHLLQYYKIPMAGKNAVVVGRSNIVGKPMAQLLLAENATVTICHSGTKNLAEWTREADICVVAAGRVGLLGAGDFKQGSVVIDVGMHGTGSGKLAGDVRWEGIEERVAAASPVPGGVGPMTITTLLENAFILAKARQKR